MAIYKVDGVDGTAHLPKKFVTLNTIIPTSTTITKGEVLMMDVVTTANGAGQNVIQAAGADLARVVGVAAETVVNSSASATKTTTIRVQVAGHNSDVTGQAADLVVGVLCGHDGVLTSIAVGDGTTGVTTRAFAICVVAATTGPTPSFTDLEILIYDHGLYG